LRSTTNFDVSSLHPAGNEKVNKGITDSLTRRPESSAKRTTFHLPKVSAPTSKQRAAHNIGIKRWPLAKSRGTGGPVPRSAEKFLP